MGFLLGRRGKIILVAILAALMVTLMPTRGRGAEAAAPPASLPGNVQPRSSDADLWRSIRQGEAGTVNNFAEPSRGVLIQSEGELWRSLRNGWLIPAAAIALAAVLLALASFYAIRGRIRLDHGPSGKMILRFSAMERLGHWLTAGSFIVLAVTGLTMMFGRIAVEPVLGKPLFSMLAGTGKWLHNIGGFFFIAGLVLIFFLWAHDNLWDRYDWNWIRQGGGLLKKGVHPPAAKFNFGEKVQFWVVILVGAFVSLTGVNLLFPLTFTTLWGMQVLQLLHAAAAVLMVMAILGHIYIGTIGMEGPATIVTTGYVDEAWAIEHHSVWVEEMKTARPGSAEVNPRSA